MSHFELLIAAHTKSKQKAEITIYIHIYNKETAFSFPPCRAGIAAKHEFYRGGMRFAHNNDRNCV